MEGNSVGDTVGARPTVLHCLLHRGEAVAADEERLQEDAQIEMAKQNIALLATAAASAATGEEKIEAWKDQKTGELLDSQQNEI